MDHNGFVSVVADLAKDEGLKVESSRAVESDVEVVFSHTFHRPEAPCSSIEMRMTVLFPKEVVADVSEVVVAHEANKLVMAASISLRDACQDIMTYGLRSTRKEEELGAGSATVPSFLPATSMSLEEFVSADITRSQYG